MYKLVVFSAFLAVAAASGIVGHSPLAYASAPLVHSYASAPLVHSYASAPLVNTYAAHVAAPAAVVNTYNTPGVAISHEITKNVHYASQPVVTGYSSQVLKPDLGALATPLHSVTQQRVLAPARTVATITPQVTQVHPELHVKKVGVDVPVASPYISEVEVRHPAPIIAPIAAAPVVHSAPIATPIVEARTSQIVHHSAPLATPIVGARAAHLTVPALRSPYW